MFDASAAFGSLITFGSELNAGVYPNAEKTLLASIRAAS